MRAGPTCAAHFSVVSQKLGGSSEGGAVWLARSKHGPDHPCILVGDRHRCAVEPAPLPKLVDPLIIGVGLVRSRSHDGAGAVNEQAYRLLKEHDLIASPAYIVMKAADEFKDKTTAPNQLWQTDFTYLKVIGWGWFYLSTILDDFSRYIIAWKLCTTMKVGDVTETLDLALQASGLDHVHVVHRSTLNGRQT